MNLGEKIKEYRAMKGMTLRELAERANLSPSMMSQIEKQSVNPSVNALRNISTALNVPIFKFFQEDQDKNGLIVRKGEYMTIGLVGCEVQYKLLTSDTKGLLESCLMDIPAGKASSDVPRSHEGEEVAYVISGETDIELDGDTYHLCEGDAIKIPSTAPHRWINRSKKDVRIIFSVTPPQF